jgi:hypothetical protein
MGQRYHPSIIVVVRNESYDGAESVLDNITEDSSLRQANKETKYERRERNGDVEEDGHIKLSLEEVESGISIYSNYSDSEITVVYKGDRNEDVSEFKQAISVFENIIYPRVAEVVGESAVRMNVTARGI